jgi:hypothetical protein
VIVKEEGCEAVSLRSAVWGSRRLAFLRLTGRSCRPVRGGIVATAGNPSIYNTYGEYAYRHPLALECRTTADDGTPWRKPWMAPVVPTGDSGDGREAIHYYDQDVPHVRYVRERKPGIPIPAIDSHQFHRRWSTNDSEYKLEKVPGRSLGHHGPWELTAISDSAMDYRKETEPAPARPPGRWGGACATEWVVGIGYPCALQIGSKVITLLNTHQGGLLPFANQREARRDTPPLRWVGSVPSVLSDSDYYERCQRCGEVDAATCETLGQRWSEHDFGSSIHTISVGAHPGVSSGGSTPSNDTAMEWAENIGDERREQEPVTKPLSVPQVEIVAIGERLLPWLGSVGNAANTYYKVLVKVQRSEYGGASSDDVLDAVRDAFLGTGNSAVDEGIRQASGFQDGEYGLNTHWLIKQATRFAKDKLERARKRQVGGWGIALTREEKADYNRRQWKDGDTRLTHEPNPIPYMPMEPTEPTLDDVLHVWNVIYEAARVRGLTEPTPSNKRTFVERCRTEPELRD